MLIIISNVTRMASTGLSSEEKLKLALYHGIKKACEDIGPSNTYVGPFTVSKEAKECMMEFMWKKLQLYGSDLEAFASHAKRTSVTADDVKLLFRNNPKILEQLKELDEEDLLESAKPETGKRKHSEIEDTDGDTRDGAPAEEDVIVLD